MVRRLLTRRDFDDRVAVARWRQCRGHHQIATANRIAVTQEEVGRSTIGKRERRIERRTVDRDDLEPMRIVGTGDGRFGMKALVLITAQEDGVRDAIEVEKLDQLLH